MSSPTQTARVLMSAAPALLICLFACMVHAADENEYKEYFPETPDPFVGDYTGRWNDEVDVDPEVWAQVIALGRDRYRIKVTAKVDMRAPRQLDVEVRAEDGKIEFEEGRFYGTIEDGVFTGGRGRNETFEMKHIVRESPQLGLEPPANGVMLYDGDFDDFQDPEGWRSLGGTTFMVTPDSDYLVTKQGYRDVRVHLEFRLAHMPRARGQQRSNSGLFVGDEYEVQILDSYGLEGVYDECGALYKVAAPKVNAAAPPLQWQTYDLIYRAPRYDANGTLTANPRMTVLHNGVLIHNDQEMGWLTGWKEVDRKQPHPKEPGHIRLQGHGNYVQFRNFWMVDLGEGGDASLP